MTTIYDPERGQEALHRMMPRLDAVAEDRLDTRTASDLQGAAIHALSVAEFCARPDIRARFEQLGAAGFDVAQLDDLADLAWAAWYIRVHVLTASAQSTGTMVPLESIERATERKRRMLRVVDYYLAEDDAAGPELRAIRSGTGYRDLAADLIRLAELHEQHESLLSADTHHYRATDVADARADATEILRHLGGEDHGPAATWLDRQRRVWALLRAGYAEVAAGGRFLFRDDSRKLRFGSLLAAGRRATRSRPRAAPEPQPEPTPQPEPVAHTA